LESKTVFNVLIACWSSTSDQAESASVACSIEHVHNFTVILPHRMQGMIPSPLLPEIEVQKQLNSNRHATKLG
jgi:hypothetical protein